MDYNKCSGMVSKLLEFIVLNSGCHMSLCVFWEVTAAKVQAHNTDVAKSIIYDKFF